MEKLMRYGLCALAAGLAVFALAACGSSKSSSSSSSPASTGSSSSGGDFATQVKTTCTDAYTKVKATLAQETAIKNAPGTNAQKRAKISPLLGDFKTELSDLHDKLVALSPPASQAAPYKQYLDSLTNVANLTGQAKTALDHNDQASYGKVNSQLQAEVKTANAAGAQVPALTPCVSSSG